jgi:hypothetical protein
VARRAEGAGGEPESTWKMVSHEGTKTRRRGDGIFHFGFWIFFEEGEEFLFKAWMVVGTALGWVDMEMVLTIRENALPSTLRSVLAALRSQKLTVSHVAKNWGDWIHLEGCETVISIEVVRGLTSTATIEYAEDDSEDILPAIQRAFHKLGWVGMDEEGEYSLF